MFWQADFFFLLYQNLNKQSCSNMLKTLPWKKINWNQQAHTHINCQSLHDCGNEIQVALKRKKIIWSVKNVYFNLLPTPKMRSQSNLNVMGIDGWGDAFDYRVDGTRHLKFDFYHHTMLWPCIYFLFKRFSLVLF